MRARSAPDPRGLRAAAAAWCARWGKKGADAQARPVPALLLRRRADDDRAARHADPGRSAGPGVDPHARQPGAAELGAYGVLESVSGSIRVEPSVHVEAVTVRCADTCFVQGRLTAWRVVARTLHVDGDAEAHVVMQETEHLEVGRNGRLVGNFRSEKELFGLFSRFSQHVRALPAPGSFQEGARSPHEDAALEAEPGVLTPEAIVEAEIEAVDVQAAGTPPRSGGVPEADAGTPWASPTCPMRSASPSCCSTRSRPRSAGPPPSGGSATGCGGSCARATSTPSVTPTRRSTRASGTARRCGAPAGWWEGISTPRRPPRAVVAAREPLPGGVPHGE